jgi:hypothetical protein
VAAGTECQSPGLLRFLGSDLLGLGSRAARERLAQHREHYWLSLPGRRLVGHARTPAFLTAAPNPKPPDEPPKSGRCDGAKRTVQGLNCRPRLLKAFSVCPRKINEARIREAPRG